jgi:PAS domain S-box-containing protein
MLGISPKVFVGKASDEIGLPKALAEPWTSVLHNVVQTGKEEKGDFEFQGPMGTRLYQYVVVPEFSVIGAIETVLSLLKDVTERVKAEEEIWQAAERNQLYLEAGDLGASERNFKTGTSFWDENARRMLGMEQEVTIKPGEENSRIHPKDKKAAEEALNQALTGANDGTYHTEFRVVLPDNSTQWIASRGQVFFEDEGKNRKPTRVISVYMNITERKKADEALRKSEEEYSSLFANMLDGFAYCQMIFDKKAKPVDFVYLQINDAFEKITGLKRDLVIGKKVTEAIPGIKAANPELFEIYGRVALTGQKEKFEVFFKPLSMWLSISVYCPAKGYFAAVFEDVTERKQQERVIENLAKFPSENPNPVFRIDGKGIILYGNSTGAPVLTAWNSKVGERAPEQISQVVTDALASRKRIELEETYGAKTFSLLFAPVTVAGYVNIYANDITERKKMEQQLSNSLEESYRRGSEISALLTASRAVLQNKEFPDSARAIFDGAKQLIGATAGYVALLSKDGKQNEVLFLDAGGLPCTVDPSLPMPIRGLRAKAYSSGEAVIENDFSKSGWKKFMPAGHVQLNNVMFAPLTIEQKVVGVIGLANKSSGFTERDREMAMAFGEIASVALANSRMLGMLEANEKELKIYSEHLEALVEERTKKLKDSERLAAIGETAGMVGHDIRNPLQSITGELYLARTNIADLPDNHTKEDLKESIGYIEEQLTYVNKIVQDLQDYAKTPKPQLQETNLEKAVQDVFSTVNIPENIKVSSNIEADFPKICTDQLYLKRILSNLTSNAVQAMPKGGKISVTATCKDEKIFITVADTGEGIPDEVKDKLFKPLFTTKAKGQGFGLAVVKKLTEALNGKVTVESQVGKGTQFTVEFPITQK